MLVKNSAVCLCHTLLCCILAQRLNLRCVEYLWFQTKKPQVLLRHATFDSSR